MQPRYLSVQSLINALTNATLSSEERNQQVITALSEMLTILEAKSDIQLNEELISCISYAVKNNYTEMIVAILKEKNLLFSVIHYLVKQTNDFDTLKAILGVVRWNSEEKENILHIFSLAVKNKKREMIKILLTTVNCTQNQIFRLLIHACILREYEMVILLLEGLPWNQANVIKKLFQINDIDYKAIDYDECDLLQRAVEFGNVAIVKAFLEKLNEENNKKLISEMMPIYEEEFCNAIDNDKFEIANAILTGVRWENQDGNYSRVLFHALNSPHASMIIDLYHHIDWNELGEGDLIDDLFHAVLTNAVDKGDSKTLKMIMEKLNQEEKNLNENKNIVLMAPIRTIFVEAFEAAIEAKNTEMAGMILVGIDWDQDLVNLVSMLDRALEVLSVEKVLEFLKTIHWNERNQQHQLALLYFTVLMGYEDVTEMLLQTGIDYVQRLDGLPFTLLDNAVQAEIESTKILKLLLTAGVEPNELNSFQKPPLTYAIKNSRVKMIIELLNFGADIRLLDTEHLIKLHSLIRPKPAAQYDQQFIERLGFLLLDKLSLKYHDAAVQKISKEAFYIIGAYFINFFSGKPSQLPRKFHVYLSNQFLLVQVEQFKNAYSDAQYSKDAKSLKKLFVRWKPSSHSSFEGYLEDYKLIARALNLEPFDPTKMTTYEYCFFVREKLNENALIAQHEQEQEQEQELKVEEKPADKLERLHRQYKQKGIDSFSKEDKAEICYQLAGASRLFAEQAETDIAKKERSRQAARFYLAAKDQGYDPEKIKILGKEIRSTYLAGNSQALFATTNKPNKTDRPKESRDLESANKRQKK